MFVAEVRGFGVDEIMGFAIPMRCYNCDKEIEWVSDIGFEDFGECLCKRCSVKLVKEYDEKEGVEQNK